jgi:lysophospholipase L1-like esterase
MTVRLPTVLGALVLAGCAGITASSAPVVAQSFAANDSRILVMGRHATSGDTVLFGASGVTFQMKFRGPSLDVVLDDGRSDSTAHEWFTVVVDGRAPTRFRTTARTARYTLASGLSGGAHTVALSKATEGQNGHDRLLAVSARELLAPDPLPRRRIEFIGNSITAGFGDDSAPVRCGAGTWYDPSHAWQSYAPRTARAVGAQWMLSAVSGIGMLRNCCSTGPMMPRVYGGVYMDYGDTATAWDFARYTPDLVVIELGTNDFSDGPGPTSRPPLDGDAFVAEYVRFIDSVRAHYPRARLLLLGSAMLDGARKRALRGYLDRVVVARRDAGDSTISAFDFGGPYTAGCSGHPDLAQQARMAEELGVEVRRVMGW